jgi:hypothetical protein
MTNPALSLNSSSATNANIPHTIPTAQVPQYAPIHLLPMIDQTAAVPCPPAPTVVQFIPAAPTATPMLFTTPQQILQYPQYQFAQFQPQPAQVIFAAAPPASLSPVSISPIKVTQATAIEARPVPDAWEVKSNPLAVVDDQSTSGKKKKRRQRSAFLSELRFKGYLDPNSNGPNSRIRIWMNDRDMHYYDCSCGKRKAVQDLYKIKQHIKRHEVSEHICKVCGKTFQHHLQMNAHMKVHKKADEVGGDIAMSNGSEPQQPHVAHHHPGSASSSSSSGSGNTKPTPAMSEFESASSSASSSFQGALQTGMIQQDDAFSTEQVDSSQSSGSPKDQGSPSTQA